MNHQLYHEGDAVLFTFQRDGIYHPTPAYILQVVKRGQSTHCPHCGRPVHVHSTAHEYGYYIDWAPPSNCCAPLSYSQLKRTHIRSEAYFKYINGKITCVE